MTLTLYFESLTEPFLSESLDFLGLITFFNIVICF